jgi:hypothetical protein
VTRALAAALGSAGIFTVIPAHAVRVNADGHGQALIYPYYTARSTPAGNAFVTALSVTNITGKPKAVKVRFLEGKAGREVFDLNLFLAAYDVWTAGIVPFGAGAALFSSDHSCSSPKVSSNSGSPSLFRNGAYVGDRLADALDRTYEGYFEMVEMGSIDPASALGLSVTPNQDLSAPNASKPSCANLPVTDQLPLGLNKPSGGLVGNVSYINVNEGTDYSVDATALSQWSDKVQWSAPGNANPNLADASPAVSFVIDSKDDTDTAYITRWNSGRDAVTALLMVNRLANEYSVEPTIKAATDWIVTMPTKRFHVSRTQIDLPFNGGFGNSSFSTVDPYYCEVIWGVCDKPVARYFDREAVAYPGPSIITLCTPPSMALCGAAGNYTFTANEGQSARGNVFGSTTLGNIGLAAPWMNGWLDFPSTTNYSSVDLTRAVSLLVSPPGQSVLVDTLTGLALPGKTVTYFGLPIIGFAVQSYSTTGLPGISPNVLSNYGGQFNHKVTRRIEVAP